MYDLIIIGAGVTGCATARQAARFRMRVLVLEAGADVAAGTSKANSAIVHAGYDAPTGSAMARTNVAGAAAFDKWSRELEFPFRRIGSLVIAAREEETPRLRELMARGEKNGVAGMELLDGAAVENMEPNLRPGAVAAALHAPSAGITCPYEMTVACAENACANGVEFRFGSSVTGVERQDGAFTVRTAKGERFCARAVLDAAGVHADDLVRGLLPREYAITPVRGEYLLFSKRMGQGHNKTVFPLPDEKGKGMLVSPTIDGNLLVGPTAEAQRSKTDVPVTREGLRVLTDYARNMVPGIDMRELITSFAGLRAREAGDDFVLGPCEIPGLFLALGIASPGLSAAPAIADELSVRIAQYLGAEERSDYDPCRPSPRRFAHMSDGERAQAIARNPLYSRIICRCELVSEGEIRDCLRRTPAPRTLDGLKRRLRLGMGLCQGGFCTCDAMAVMADELGVPLDSLTKSGDGSPMVMGRLFEEKI